MRSGTSMTHYGKLTISLTLCLLVGLVCGKAAVFCCLLLKQRCQELFSACGANFIPQTQATSNMWLCFPMEVAIALGGVVCLSALRLTI